MNSKLMEVKQGQTLPLVTIVTITYNLVEKKRVEYIKQCIESVHSQTYSAVEHIVIDGASNDGTLELLKVYEDLNYIEIYSERDNGIYDAMNKGLARAKGKYVNFLNSDDYFHNKEAVELSVKYLEEKGAGYSFADAMLLYENGAESLWKGNVSKLLWGSHYCHQTMFVKTDLLRAIGGFDLSYTISADTELMIRLYAQSVSYVKIPFCVATYRVGGCSSQNQLQSRMDHSSAFYKHIGKNIGLSIHDCFLFWNQCLFDEIPISQQLDLISKVPIEYGLEYLLHEFTARFCADSQMLKNRKYYLLGFIPLLKCESRGSKKYFSLFNILKLLKLVDRNNKRKYYLFCFIPLWKIKYF